MSELKPKKIKEKEDLTVDQLFDRSEAQVEKALELANHEFDDSNNKINRRQHQTRAVAWMAAWGMNNKEIAKNLNVRPDFVNRLTKSRSFCSEVDAIQSQLFFKDSKKVFEKILPVAVRVMYNVMIDKKTKDSVRVDAASKLIDRSLGKPTQTVEHGGNMLSQLLDELNKPKTINIDQSNIEEAQIVKENDEIEESDPKRKIARWLAEKQSKEGTNQGS